MLKIFIDFIYHDLHFNHHVTYFMGLISSYKNFTTGPKKQLNYVNKYKFILFQVISDLLLFVDRKKKKETHEQCVLIL